MEQEPPVSDGAVKLWAGVWAFSNGQIFTPATARRISAALYAVDPAQAGWLGDVFLASQTKLWGILSGAGYFEGVLGRTTGAIPIYHISQQVAESSIVPRAGFLILGGSYFADWNIPNNLMRVCLGAQDVCLAVMWGGDGLGGQQHAPYTGPWKLDATALGKPLGQALQDTIGQGTWQSARAVFILGDPTLSP